MDKIKKNITVIVNVITLLIVICTAIYGYGRLNARVDNIEIKQNRMELHDIEINKNYYSIIYKLGKIESKINILVKRSGE